MHYVTLRHVRATFVTVEKSISVTYSEFMFVAFGIQHSLRMRIFVICGLSGSTLFFHIVSYNGTIFGKKFTDHKMCVFIFCTTSV